MAANRKFTPRASSNLIEGEVTDVVNTPEEEIPVEPVTAEEVVAEENTDEVASVDSEEVAPLAEAETTPEITFTPETNKTPIERMVKIRLAKKYNGCIGGIWYHFEKDQVVNVPENVKRILNSAEGMLKPL